jgi:hypothetical protein
MTGELSAEYPSIELERQGKLLVLPEQTPDALGLTSDTVVAPLVTDAETLRAQTGIEGMGDWDAIAANIRHAAGHDVARRAIQEMQKGRSIHDMVVEDALALEEHGLNNAQVGGFLQYAKVATDYLHDKQPDRETYMAFQYGPGTFVASKQSVRGYTTYELTSLMSGSRIAFNDRGPDQAVRGIYEDVAPLQLAEFAGFIDRGDPVTALSRDISAHAVLSATDAMRADSLAVYGRQLLTGENYTVSVRSLQDTVSLAGYIKRFGDSQGMLAHAKDEIAVPAPLHVADWEDRARLEALPAMPDTLRTIAYHSVSAITLELRGHTQDNERNRKLVDDLIETALLEDTTPATREAALLVGKFDQQDPDLRARMYKLVASRYKALAGDAHAQTEFVVRVEQVAPAFTANMLAAYAANGVRPSEPTLQALLAEQEMLEGALELRDTIDFLKRMTSLRANNFEGGVVPEKAAVDEAIEVLARVVQHTDRALTASDTEVLVAAGVKDPELIAIALEKIGDDKDDRSPDIALGTVVRALFEGSALREKRERATARERAAALASVQELIDPEAYGFFKTIFDGASQYVVEPGKAAAATINAIKEAYVTRAEQGNDEPPPARTLDDVVRLFVTKYKSTLTELVQSKVVTAATVDANTIRLQLDPDFMAEHPYQDHPGDGLPWPGKKFDINGVSYVYNQNGTFQSSFQSFGIKDPDGKHPTVVVTLS